MQVDHWLEFSACRLCGRSDLSLALLEVDKTLALRTFLVGRSVTLADLSVWSALKGKAISCTVHKCKHQNVVRNKSRRKWFQNLGMFIKDTMVMCIVIPEI